MFEIKRQVTGPQGINVCSCSNVKPVEAVKTNDGRNNMQFGKCSALSVNTLLLAYAMRKSVRQQNELMQRIALIEKTYQLQAGGRGIRRYNSLAGRWVKQYINSVSTLCKM